MSIPSLTDGVQPVYVANGRTAIAIALSCVGIEPGDRVLVPACHCITMVEPILGRGAEPVFYRINKDMSVDLEDAAAKLDDRVRMMMVVNYFGFPQDLALIRKFCDDRAVPMLEDCAHCYFGVFDGKPAGGHGDFAIASPRKFFPIEDGGVLVSHRRAIKPKSLVRPNLVVDLKTAFQTLERAVGYRRLPALRPAVGLAAGIGATKSLLAGGAEDTSGWDPYSAEAASALWDGDGAPEKEILSAMTRSSYLVYRLVSRSRIVKRRRENYRSLLDGLSDLPGCRPLFPELPDGVVPHLFPLWVDNLDEVFADLEDAAVPMQRFGQFLWPGVDETICPVSAAVSHNLVQFPCHQELTETELASVVDRVRAKLRNRTAADGRHRLHSMAVQ